MADYVRLDLPFCTWAHQHSAECADRVRRAHHAMELVHQALVTVEELKKNRVPRFAQLDLLAPAADEEMIAFWWSVYRACGVEFRRMERIFWKRCKHGKTQAGQGNGP